MKGCRCSLPSGNYSTEIIDCRSQRATNVPCFAIICTCIPPLPCPKKSFPVPFFNSARSNPFLSFLNSDECPVCVYELTFPIDPSKRLVHQDCTSGGKIHSQSWSLLRMLNRVDSFFLNLPYPIPRLIASAARIGRSQFAFAFSRPLSNNFTGFPCGISPCFRGIIFFRLFLTASGVGLPF